YRDELLRKLVRPVVVGAVGGDDRQSVSMEISPRQVIGGGLGCRIWAVGWVGAGFRKCRIARFKAAVHLVGRDVEETKGLPLPSRQFRLVRSRCLKQAQGTHNV